MFLASTRWPRALLPIAAVIGYAPDEIGSYGARLAAGITIDCVAFDGDAVMGWKPIEELAGAFDRRDKFDCERLILDTGSSAGTPDTD